MKQLQQEKYIQIQKVDVDLQQLEESEAVPPSPGMVSMVTGIEIHGGLGGVRHSGTSTKTTQCRFLHDVRKMSHDQIILLSGTPYYFWPENTFLHVTGRKGNNTSVNILQEVKRAWKNLIFRKAYFWNTCAMFWLIITSPNEPAGVRCTGTMAFLCCARHSIHQTF